jgi:hypothetical protein
MTECLECGIIFIPDNKKVSVYGLCKKCVVLGTPIRNCGKWSTYKHNGSDEQFGDRSIPIGIGIDGQSRFGKIYRDDE